jgi:hypothetical protein
MKTKYNNRNLSHLQIGTLANWRIVTLSHYHINKLAWCIVFILALFSSCTSDKNLAVQRELKIEQYYPNSGQGGTLVTIKGEGFNESIDGNSVEFAGVKAEVFSAKENELVVLSPKAGQTGSLKINNGQKSIEVGNFTYQTLSVQKISPTNGSEGMNIRITGAGFSSSVSPATVFINGTQAVVVNVSDTLIVAKVPANAGKGPVKVVVDGKESVGEIFTYQSIYRISPLTGGKGTRITVNGTGFDPVATNNTVTFSSLQARVIEATESKLIVEAPANVATNKIAVIINGQKTVGPVFTVVPPPSLSVITPLSGPVGSQISIKGLNFSTITAENKVFINGTEIPVKTASATELSLTLPGGIGTGKIEVAVNDQRTTGPEFKTQNLGITKVSPESGLSGTVVTLTGTGFSTDAAQNTVTFNNAPAVITSASATSLTVVAPANLATGVLKVVTAGLEAAAPNTFNRAGVTTFAGSKAGTTLPTGLKRIALDSHNNVYVSTTTEIYKITPDGSIALFVGTGAKLGNISGLTIDSNNNLYVADVNVIKKISPAGTVTQIDLASVTSVGSISVDAQDNIYIILRLTDSNGSFNGICKLDTKGNLTKVASWYGDFNCRPAVLNGTVYYSPDAYDSYLLYCIPPAYPKKWIGTSGTTGYKDGSFSTALFNYGIKALVLDQQQNVYVLDPNNYAIRYANLTAQTVSTTLKLSSGNVDGDFTKAKWGASLTDMALDSEGNIYVVDATNKAIRKVYLK